MRQLWIRLAMAAGLVWAAGSAQAESYALMFGINDYPAVTGSDGKPLKDANGEELDNDLRGCVNDVTTMKKIVSEKFGMSAGNVKTVLNKEANEAGFIDGWKWLLTKLQPGDQVLFYYSGHGAQIESKAEEDGKDEVIVLSDEKLVTDDFFAEMGKEFAKSGINATFVFDSCFSGGMSRDGARTKNLTNLIPLMKNAKAVAGQKLKGIQGAVKPKSAKVETGEFAWLFAGQEDQPTIDLGGSDKLPAHGLFTLFLTTVLEELPDAPLGELVEAIEAAIAKNEELKQRPRAEFSSAKRAGQPLLLK